MIQHFTLDVKQEMPEKSFSSDGPFVSDITDEVAHCLEDSKITNGIGVVQSLHTTLALAINENETGLLIHDFPNLFQRIVPLEKYYRHDDFTVRTEFDSVEPERINGRSHCRAILLSHSVQIIIKDGNLLLGTWQRVLLFEFDGCGRKDRNLALLFMGEQ